MWCIRAIGFFGEGGTGVRCFATLSELEVYPTLVMNYFSNAPVFTVYDLLLNTFDANEYEKERLLKKINNALQKEETQGRITSA